MKRILSILFVFALLFSLISGCSQEIPVQPTATPAPQVTQDTTHEPAPEPIPVPAPESTPEPVITGEELKIGNMEVHHKTPKFMGGSDKYNNLVFVTVNAHKLIHATIPETIIKYLGRYPKNTIDFKRLNNLRLLVGNCEIVQ